MKINIVTIFPEMFESYLNASLLGKAQESGLLEFNFVNIRDFADNKHNKVDDEPYGGGAGMVMQAPPIFKAIESLGLGENKKIIFPSPQGKVFKQADAKSLSKEDELTFICGRYEGVDERVIENLVTDEYSIGDYVVTGGELPTMVILDAIARMIPDVVGKLESVQNDSFYGEQVFDHPHYTRPPEFNGMNVPEVLMGGNHAEINKWRREKAIEKTKRVRPDLLGG